MQAVNNQYTKALEKVGFLPRKLRFRAFTYIFGRMIRFFRTVGLEYEELTAERAVLLMKNRRGVQNHIKTVHASAIAALAESASGAVMAVNVPEERVPVIKTMRMDYLRRAQGDLRAVSTLTPEQIEHIRNTDHGELEVAVQVTDESGREPVECSMLWVWIPRERPTHMELKSVLQSLLTGADDNDLSFERLCRMLRWLGFQERIRGNHHIFARADVNEILNLQPRGVLAKPEQVKRVREVVLKYQLGVAAK